jgi:hypothetical protein
MENNKAHCSLHVTAPAVDWTQIENRGGGLPMVLVAVAAIDPTNGGEVGWGKRPRGTMAGWGT